MHRRHFLQAGSALALAPSLSRAELTVEIEGMGATGIPVAVAGFSGEAALGKPVSDVVRTDLERSGLFRQIDTGNLPLADFTKPDFAGWQAKGADVLLAGALRSLPDGSVEASYRLYDVVNRVQQKDGVLSFRPDLWRRAGHWIADRIYEQIMKQPGVFSTQIAYVQQSGRTYMLQVAEYDGANPMNAFSDDEPIISPAWSPDGTRLAYVGFSLRKPVIYVQNLAKGQRQVIANFKGSNSAPAWSPDGKRLAIVLTKDQGSQVYVINADGSGLNRLMQSNAIDTEPVFSADGKWIYFTSDRSGGPQIYRIPADGGNIERVTFEGAYNVSPRISPDGRTIAYIARNGGNFKLTVQDLATQQTLALTDTNRDESPSFSPNGRLILYATVLGGRGVLSAVSIDGKIRYKPLQGAGDIREPAWGPLST